MILNTGRMMKGIVQIPILIGLLIMAVAVPVATKLVQENQNNQGKAAPIPDCSSSADCGSGYYCANGRCYKVNVNNTPVPTNRPPEACIVSSWSNATDCSQSCGGGTLTQRSNCNTYKTGVACNTQACATPVPKKYSCNSSTGTCGEDANGPYTSSGQCSNNCKANPTQAPACGGLGQNCCLTEYVLGTPIYNTCSGSLKCNSAKCSTIAQPIATPIPTLYGCNTGTGKCGVVAGGAYTSEAQCSNNCKANPTQAPACGGLGQNCCLTEYVLGTPIYNTCSGSLKCNSAKCSTIAQPIATPIPTLYSCNPVTKTCSIDTLGSYTSYGQCASNCTGAKPTAAPRSNPFPNGVTIKSLRELIGDILSKIVKPAQAADVGFATICGSRSENTAGTCNWSNSPSSGPWSSWDCAELDQDCGGSGKSCNAKGGTCAQRTSCPSGEPEITGAVGCDAPYKCCAVNLTGRPTAAPTIGVAATLPPNTNHCHTGAAGLGGEWAVGSEKCGNQTDAWFDTAKNVYRCSATGTWDQVKTCDKQCIDGSCVESVCSLMGGQMAFQGSKACGKNTDLLTDRAETVMKCVDDGNNSNKTGNWVEDAACTGKCENGACLPANTVCKLGLAGMGGVVNLGTRKCGSETDYTFDGVNTVQECVVGGANDTSGQWSKVKDCPGKCANGVCTDKVCKVGVAGLDGRVAIGGQECGSMTDSLSDGANDVMKCVDNGAAWGEWQKVSTCPSKCAGGSCSEAVCRTGLAGLGGKVGVGSKECGNNTDYTFDGVNDVMVCTSEGKWEKVKTCDSNCASGQCSMIEGIKCTPGEKKCTTDADGKMFTSMCSFKNGGYDWDTGTECANGCYGGVCNETMKYGCDSATGKCTLSMTGAYTGEAQCNGNCYVGKCPVCKKGDKLTCSVGSAGISGQQTCIDGTPNETGTSTQAECGMWSGCTPGSAIPTGTGAKPTLPPGQIANTYGCGGKVTENFGCNNGELKDLSCPAGKWTRVFVQGTYPNRTCSLDCSQECDWANPPTGTGDPAPTSGPDNTNNGTCNQSCSGNLLQDCKNGDTDGTSRDTTCNTLGKTDTCGGTNYCCPSVGGNWTTDMTKCSTAGKCTQCEGKPGAKLKGDADCSGDTTINDYQIWIDEFKEGALGKTNKSTWKADIDCNGVVDINDYQIWIDNFKKVNSK